jgi:hypothetical protein
MKRFTPSQLVVMWMAGFMVAAFAFGMLGAREETRTAGWIVVGVVVVTVVFLTLFARKRHTP